MNIDVKKLNGCYMLWGEIKYLNEKIERERVLLYGRGNGISDMPRGSSEKGLDVDVARFEDLKNLRRERIDEYAAQVEQSEKVLEQIDDASIRLMLRLIYIERMPIKDVAALVHMSESTVRRNKKRLEQADGIG